MIPLIPTYYYYLNIGKEKGTVYFDLIISLII
jgi:hypothetical protein